MATDQEQTTDETSRVTAAALAAAKEVINNGGTQSEAAAAAKQVATNMLLKSKKKKESNSSTGGSDKSGKDSNTSSSPMADKSGRQDGVSSDKASLATPPKKISTDNDTPKSKTSLNTKKNKSGGKVVEVSGHPSNKSTSTTKATVAAATTTANATISTAANSSNAGSRLLNKFRKKKSSSDKVKKKKKKKKSKKTKQKPVVTENKQATTNTAHSKVKSVPEEESHNNKEDKVLTYSPNNEQQTQEVISQVSKSLNKSKVGLTTAAKSAIQSIRNKSPTLPSTQSKHTKKRHPDYHPNHTKQEHHHRHTSSSVGSLTNSSATSSSYSSSYYYDTNTESLDSYEIEMLYHKDRPAILESASSNASSYAQLRGKADTSNNDARGRSVESEDRYSQSIMSMYGLLDAVDDVLFPQNDDDDNKKSKKKDTKKKDTPKKQKDTLKEKKDTTAKSMAVVTPTKEKTKEKNRTTTKKKKENNKVVIEKTPDKEPSESSWFWKLCGATQLLNCTETSIKTDDCSSTFQESQGSTTLDDYSSSNKEESIVSLDGTDNTTKSGTAVSTNKGQGVSSTTTSNEGKTREAVTAEMLLEEVKNEKREKKVQNNDADDSTLDSSLLKAIGRGVMRDARKNSNSNKSTTSKVVIEEESSLVLGKEDKGQDNNVNNDKKIVPVAVAASNENDSVSSKMKTMFRNTMGRCSVNPQYCNSQNNLDNSLHYPGQQAQPQPAALDDNPNWRDLVEDTVQTKEAARVAPMIREQSNMSQQQVVARGQGYQATSGYQASPPSTSHPSQHVQVGHFQTTVQPQQQHHFSPQQVGGYQGNQVVQQVGGGYQGSPPIQMNSPPQASPTGQRGVEQVWQPNYQVKPPEKTYSPSVPKVNSNFSVESMDEREDRYAGEQEEERRDEPIYSYNIPEQRQQQQYQQRITTVQQANGATHTIRQDYNGGGQQVTFNAQPQHSRPLMMSNGKQVTFNAQPQHPRPPMMSNVNPNLNIQPPQYQQQQYRPQQQVRQTRRAPMPQTRQKFNSMPPPIHMQHQQYHKSQQQRPPASFRHIVDPNPSSIGYYEQARYRTFAA